MLELLLFSVICILLGPLGGILGVNSENTMDSVRSPQGWRNGCDDAKAGISCIGLRLANMAFCVLSKAWHPACHMSKSERAPHR
jgi:hypothetical protein